MNTISKSMLGGIAAMAVMALGGSAYAQAPAPAADATKSGTMASEKSKMSTEDMAAAKKCKAMTPEAMAADAKCKALMAAHPHMASGEKTKPAEKPK